MIPLEHKRHSFFDLRLKDKVLVDQIPYTIESSARGGMGGILLLKKDDGYVPHSLSTLSYKLALKTVLPEVADDDGIALFRREVTVWAGFRHPNIVRLLAIVDGGDAGWVAAMAWCPGSLRDILENRGVLSLKNATNIVENLIDGLDHAYSENKVLHLDLKPENVLYQIDFGRQIDKSKESEGSLTKYKFMISDWGIASIKQPQLNAIAGVPPNTAAAQRTFNNLGTMFYMAPERFREGYTSSVASDMFSIGMIYLEMLVGQLPFRQDVNAVQSIISGQYIQDCDFILRENNVPKSTVNLILSMIAYSPAERPQGYSILRKQLLSSWRKSNGILSKLFN